MPGSASTGRTFLTGLLCAALALPLAANAQVFIVEQQHISPRYAHIQPTHVRLSPEPITTYDREELIRYLQSQQGFAMRPLPVGVVTLRANSGMEPAGGKYVDELHSKGIAAQPGGRVTITDVHMKGNRIILDLNNGPYRKHRFMRHVSIGLSPYDTDPTALSDGPPTGTRIVLEFDSRKIPDLSGQQVEALLKPMVDFGVMSPAEAYAETLPDFLRSAIDQHRVLVGMDESMVLYAKGEPIQKFREQQGGQNFEIWEYGQSPDPVEFVRFIGSFVTRVEIAKVGEPLLVHSANEMGDYWGHQPVVAANQHQVQLGDRSAQSIAQESAPTAPPTLRNPGEKLPNDQQTGVMRPVKFPPGMQRPGDPGYTPPPSTASPGSGTQKAQSASATGTAAAHRQPQQAGSSAQPSGTPQQQFVASSRQPVQRR